MASFEDVTDFWKKARGIAEQGAVAAANAGAQYIQKRIQEDTLMRSQHPTNSWHETRDGDPPATASGKLIRETYWQSAFGNWARATAAVGNSADYGRILEFGCVIYPVNKKYLHWTDSGGSWYHTFLVVKEHPFIRTTMEESIDDGSLHEVMIDEFHKYDP